VVFDPFMEAEQCINLTLPPWLKKMLVINGYNNSTVIGIIDDKDIVNIEEFGRTTLPDIIESSEYGEYYGVFKNNITKFKILDGFKKQLMLVVNYYKKINMNKVEDEVKDKRKYSDINKINEAKRVKKNSLTNSKSNTIIGSNYVDQNVDLEIDLHEEKKSVLNTASEWLKGHYYSTNEELVEHMISSQTVTVALSSNNDFENENIND